MVLGERRPAPKPEREGDARRDLGGETESPGRCAVRKRQLEIGDLLIMRAGENRGRGEGVDPVSAPTPDENSRSRSGWPKLWVSIRIEAAVTPKTRVQWPRNVLQPGISTMPS